MNAINMAVSMPNQVMENREAIDGTVGTEVGISFKEAFKEAVENHESALLDKDQDFEEDEAGLEEDLAQLEASGLNFFKAPLEVDQGPVQIDLNLQLGLEEKDLSLEAGKTPDLDLIDGQIPRLDLQEEGLKMEELSRELGQDDQDLEPTILGEKPRLSAPLEGESSGELSLGLNNSEQSPIVDSEGQVEGAGKENNFKEALNKSLGETDRKEVGGGELPSKNLEKIVNSLDKLTDIEGAGESKVFESKLVEAKLDAEIGKSPDGLEGLAVLARGASLERSLASLTRLGLAGEDLQQFRKENIEIVTSSILKLMETTKEGDTNIMKVKLYPKELGNIDVLLTMNESKLEVRIMVENQNIKDMFGDSAEKFNQNLAKQSINLQEFSVDVRKDFNPGQGSQGQEARKNPSTRFKVRASKEEIGDERYPERSELGGGGISILA